MSSIRRPEATLDDRWEKTGDTLYLTGIQALVRLPLLRHQLDQALGWKTGGYISGYRGSPLGTYDMQLMRQRKRLAESSIVVRPALNEDLAATAVWGTQQVALYGNQTVDGVFGIWYGKGPGVDRSGDALRHANSAGTAPRGGVLALAGDDPSCKSSTITSGCEYSFMDLEMPVLDPAGAQEVLEFGLKAIDMSRFAGLWVGMKCVAETMDGAGTVLVDPAAYAVVTPDFAFPPDGVHIRLRDHAIPQEQRLRQVKLPAALAFARANGLNPVVLDAGARARFGIAARGKGYATLRQALKDAGISDEMARMGGLRIWKVGLAWPLDQEGPEFARGLEEILVVEDRRPVLEPLLREALYHEPVRPRITGKVDEQGRLLSDLTELDTGAVLRALALRLPEALRTEQLKARIAELDQLAGMQAAPIHDRAPHFCPGCPHNTSTRVPEGSHAMAGIGCHTLAIYMDRNTDLFTHMGAEGVPWLGMAPFVSEKHMFVNLGDGTYAHSGLLAIRQSIAAKANMTYKILVNSAVAMTGGQTPEGEPGVPEIAAQVAAEGAARIVVVSDDPERHQGNKLMPKGIAYHHRGELDLVQRQLREVPGVTVLIYDQQCATERRRKRKRGTQAVSTKRVAINPRVCEDCGDCSRASNCIAVEPIETEFGRKRAIDQSACNQDLSCVEGFCPSFVTLVGAEPVKKKVPVLAGGPLPEPVRPEVREGEPAFNILLAGVGGQGVTALSAILGQAAHLEDRPARAVDMLGLAQKGGGVFAQLRIGRVGAAPESIESPRIGMGQADLLVSADLVVAQGRTARPLLGAGRTAAVLNTDLQPTAQFVLNTETRYDGAGMLESVRRACREMVTVPGVQVIEEALGDLIYLNVWLLGIAYQKGMVPLSAEAIERALELNGAQIERNKAAFALGRQAALAPPAPAPVRPEDETLEALIARRTADLTAYQNARYARDYAGFVGRVRIAEQAAVPGTDHRLARAVATQLYRLMAYKDEYEVARLHSAPEWQGWLDQHFTGTQRVELSLAPPILAKPDPVTGLPRKRSFGPWMLKAMRLLRHGKALRGSALDPFGRTEERRTERALPAEFRAGVERMLRLLSPATHAAICAWAEAWAGIKGYGHVKARNLDATLARLATLEAAVSASAPLSAAAIPALAAE